MYRGTWNLKCVSTHECCAQKYSWEWMNTNYQVLLVTGDYLRLVSQAVASYKFPLFERSKPNFSFLSSETLKAKLQQLGGLLFKWQPIRVDGGGGGTVQYKTAPSSNKILTTLITLIFSVKKYNLINKTIILGSFVWSKGQCSRTIQFTILKTSI